MLVSFAVLSSIIAYQIYSLPLPKDFAEPRRAAFEILDRDGELMAVRGVSQGQWVALEDFPRHLVDAVIAVEDRRFYDHAGIDLFGILRAAYVNLSEGDVRQGGSTITQQLVKNEFLTPQQTFARKIQEAVIALWLERKTTKEQILEHYLNVIYLGAGAYGVDAASRRYFGKPATRVSLAEAAMLAGLIHAPSRDAPTRSIERAHRRASLVLDAMITQGRIPTFAIEAARASPATLARAPQEPVGYGYAADWAAGVAASQLGDVSGDFRITTTLDQRLQRLAHEAIEEALSAKGKELNVQQAAIVAMSPDGAVRAVVGGRDYFASQFNRAAQAKRQPGSVFKFFIYLAALAEGAPPDSPVIDDPVKIDRWRPHNHSGVYHGEVTLREAFAKSYNAAAVRLQERLGRDKVATLARSMGLKLPPHPHPSMALGTYEASLVELTAAFAAVRANRLAIKPRLLQSVETLSGATFRPPEESTSTPPWPRAQMLLLLGEVVRSGTGKGAQLAVPAYGKTGTTQDNRDAWFIGFAGDLVAGVWVGNDDGSAMNRVTGSGLPTQIWRSFMAKALSIEPAPPPLAARPQAVIRQRPFPSDVLTGVPTVLDTGRLRIGGEIVKLEGVQGFAGAHAREMDQYIGGREVICESAAARSYRCELDGWNLSEVVIFNGGGRATTDAPSHLLAAEQKARTAGRGIWARR